MLAYGTNGDKLKGRKQSLLRESKGDIVQRDGHLGTKL